MTTNPTGQEALIERLRALLAEATPLPWAYRPCQYDDWGWIRGPEKDSEIGRYRPIVANARNSDVDEEAMSEHRRNKTDPYGPNALLIVEAVNALPHLIEALSSTPESKTPSREEIARVIDPDAWRLIDHWAQQLNDRPDLYDRISGKSASSLAKADAILAMLSSSPNKGEG